MATVTAGTEQDLVFGNMRARIATFTAIADGETYDTGLRRIYFATIEPDEALTAADYVLGVRKTAATGGSVTFSYVAGTNSPNTATLFVLGT